MFKMRTRSVLKDLQVSAADKTILVGSPEPKMVSSKRAPISLKCFEISKEKPKVPKRVLEKENSKSSKVSKPKNTKIEKVSKIAKSEVKKSSLKLKKETAKLNVASNHLKVNSTSDEDVSTQYNITNVTVNQNVSDIIPVVTSFDSNSFSYWQDLAEQRRIALEKALFENEQ
ncbi:uncharacterized protein [Parasteatoda tepidariorum]